MRFISTDGRVFVLHEHELNATLDKEEADIAKLVETDPDEDWKAFVFHGPSLLVGETGDDDSWIFTISEPIAAGEEHKLFESRQVLYNKSRFL